MPRSAMLASQGVILQKVEVRETRTSFKKRVRYHMRPRLFKLVHLTRKMLYRLYYYASPA